MSKNSRNGCRPWLVAPLIAILALTSIDVTYALEFDEVIYGNSTGESSGTYAPSDSTREFGDEVRFAQVASPIIVTALRLEYFSDEKAGKIVVRLRNNDGPAIGASGAKTPLSLLYESAPIALETGAATLTIAPLSVLIPGNSVTLTVQFSDFNPTQTVGLKLRNPPEVGSSFNDLWINDGGWSLRQIQGKVANFAVRITAGPDRVSPELKVEGHTVIRHPLGTRFTGLEASASDLVDGVLPVSIGGQVNPNALGSYVLTYTATDAAGNGVSTSRIIEVYDPTASNPPTALNDAYVLNEDSQLNVSAAAGLFNNDSVGGDAGLLTLVSSTAPQNGSVSIQPNGGFRYTPNLDFNGEDFFTYSIVDSEYADDSAPVTSSAKVILTVQPVDDLPAAMSDDYTVNEDNTLTVSAGRGVLINDNVGGDGGTLAATKVVDPSHGTLTLDLFGGFTYIPNLDFNGEDVFTYNITDSDGDADTATVAITVHPVHDVPLMADDVYEMDEDAQLIISSAAGVLANDAIGGDGGQLAVIENTQPQNGTLRVAPDGSFSYTPRPNFFGEDVFVYAIADQDGTHYTAEVTLTVHPVDDLPLAVNDAYEVDEDVQLSISNAAGVLLNDSIGGDGGRLSAVINAQPQHGAARLEPDGSFVYVPQKDYHGEDAFTYSITDSDGSRATAKVIIMVLPQDERPVMSNDFYVIQEDKTLTVLAGRGVLANDVGGGDGGKLSVIEHTQPLHGALTLNADGSFSYIPNLDFNGEDVFVYAVADQDGTHYTAEVTLTVHPVDDFPVAVNDPYKVEEDAQLSISTAAGVLANDSIGGDGGRLSVTEHTRPEHGSLRMEPDGSFNYVPRLDYHGEDAFSYTISDSNGSRATAKVRLTVASVNDLPIARDDRYQLIEDQAFTMPPNDQGGEGEQAPDPGNMPPRQGSLQSEPIGRFCYTPNRGFFGQDAFTYTTTYTLIDASGSVVITPVIRAVKIEMEKHDELPGEAPADAENPTITEEIAPSQGRLTLNTDGGFCYLPTGDSSRSDTFSYSIMNEQGTTAIFTVTIELYREPEPPIEGEDDDSMDMASRLGVLANDEPGGDGGELVATKVTGPSHGALILNGEGSFSYTPEQDFSGVDSFVYSIADSDGDTDIATVTLVVLNQNDFPIAVDDSYALDANTRLNIPLSAGVLLNDNLGGDGGELFVTENTQPKHGALRMDSDGTFTYVPVANYHGVDHFTYSIADKDGDLAIGTVTLKVKEVNTPPLVRVPASLRFFENELIVIDLELSDDQVPVDELEVSISSSNLELIDVANLEIRVVPSGRELIIPPVRDASGDVDLEISVSDGFYEVIHRVQISIYQREKGSLPPDILSFDNPSPELFGDEGRSFRFVARIWDDTTAMPDLKIKVEARTLGKPARDLLDRESVTTEIVGDRGLMVSGKLNETVPLARLDFSVSDEDGQTTTAVLKLQSAPGVVPLAENRLEDIYVQSGTELSLDYVVTGTEPIRYQWLLNGEVLDAANQSNFPLQPAVSRANSGSYVLQAKNAEGALLLDPVIVSLDWLVLEGGDQFDEATLISGDKGEVRATNIDATFENDEPMHVGKRGGKSIWYRWNPLNNGVATLSLQGSSFDTLLSVYTGTSLDQLVALKSDDDRGGFSTSALQFNAEAGVDYFIAIDGFDGVFGNILFSWELDSVIEVDPYRPPVASNALSDAVLPTGSELTLDFGITTEEPPDFRWFLNGILLQGANQATLPILPGLTRSNSGSYLLRAENEDATLLTDPVVLSLDWPQVNGGDQFVDATSISGNVGEVRASNVGATFEPGEPNHGGKPGGTSIWYRWRPEQTGPTTLSLEGSSFDTLLSVYVGLELIQLTELENDDDLGGFSTSALKFNAEAGVDYFIAIDGFDGASGNILFSWDLDPTKVPLPRIRISPDKNSVTLGEPYQLRTSISGSLEGITLQWFLNGAPIPGANGTAWDITSAQPEDAGAYWIVVQGINSEAITPSADCTVNVPRRSSEQDQAGVIREIVPQKKFADLFLFLQVNTSPLQPLGDEEPFKERVASLATGFTGSQIFNTFGATKEAGEPDHCGIAGGASQWFAYQAPADGNLNITTDGSDFDTVMGVYTSSGSSFSTLKEVACDNDSGFDGQDSSVTFSVTAGTLYYIAVDGVGGVTGTVNVSYDLDVGLELTGAALQNEGLQFEVLTVPDIPFVIEGSDDFINWNVLIHASSFDGTFIFMDNEALTGSHQFYRVYIAE
ncbi:MAG: Ig-like domain-containing protein [Verrucomicrobiota bacterium]|nr:Ig-like domain-containing protein [Verrucomicrobiota bacterium]